MPQIVLVQPQIPPNTGNIARTCAATETPLHLVAPLGFEISDRHLKRAGLDYWPYVDIHYHADIEQFEKVCFEAGGRTLGLSVRGDRSYTDFSFREDDWLLFGSETSGLSPQILDKCDATLYIPMTQKEVRSLNLANSVAIVLFEARRQLGHLSSGDQTGRSESD
ncbi:MULTISPECIES: tRNA (cytidine(34)-2'-O)-methyltransferase [Spirulina sp. CCY15215]|uniref:tRNA (cytidine(34)-2'-O)-methyltransferase n=1 Tax=Spirulina sp. CCY15215 TaxID=2767591 RepID=UPI00194ECB62|nr:tRNA (cytidine(34)-2'-O)-methyltransferase [Spirulina major]